MYSGEHPQVVVITGASAGVGRAVACEFVRHGAHVRLLARSGARLQQACEEDRELGGRGLALVVDAHGRFDDRTRAASLQLLFTMHRAMSAWVGLLMLATVALLLWWVA